MNNDSKQTSLVFIFKYNLGDSLTRKIWIMQGRLINLNLIIDSNNCLPRKMFFQILHKDKHFLQLLINNQMKIRFFVKLVKNFRIQNLLWDKTSSTLEAEQY